MAFILGFGLYGSTLIPIYTQSILGWLPLMPLITDSWVDNDCFYDAYY
jgi:hypothetical protein